MSKLTILLATGVGYVLGARAGTERYEQIKASANRLWEHPRVQEQAAHVQALVKENVTDAAGRATTKAKGKSGSEAGSGAANRRTDTSAH